MNRGHKRTDLIMIDFKAFEKVPHKRLLHKLYYYEIKWSTHKSINPLLFGRSLQVTFEDQASDQVPVLSGVPRDWS